jgi:N-acetylglucosamine-6-sulfatase
VDSLRAGTRFRALVAVLSCGCLLAGLWVGAASASAGHHHKPRRRTANHRPTPSVQSQNRPNIVFVLTDDLSSNLLRFMPHVLQMQRQGVTFKDYFVSDSLCCPSRASTFTGNFPHDTGIYSNTGKHGGFDQFYARGEAQRTFAVALERAGYRTAMMGKYLNGYMGQKGMPAVAPATYVAPGWTRWDVAGWGYPEFDYALNQNGRLHSYGDRPSDYLTDVLSRDAVSFINNSTAARKPFFLEVATFAPHSPFVPAPRNSGDFPGLTAPEPASFNQLPVNAPAWLANHPRLGPGDIATINRDFRKRAQSVEAVDDMIGQIEATLAADHVQGNTYVVFSSDNGLHMGEYRLMPGKMTAFDTDIRVPLIVDGPGVAAGSSSTAMAENIDLAKTFTAIGGTTLPSDGHSLLGLLHGVATTGWRNAILVEHQGPVRRRTDPDFQLPVSGNPPSYEAMRTHDFLYVEYKDGEREYYDLRSDPFELDNLAPYLSAGELAELHAELLAMEHCHNGAACWAAMHVGTAAPDVRRRG